MVNVFALIAAKIIQRVIEDRRNQMIKRKSPKVKETKKIEAKLLILGIAFADSMQSKGNEIKASNENNLAKKVHATFNIKC